MSASSEHLIVTGGAGFIGSHLVARLVASGRRVTVIDNFSTGRRDNLRALESSQNLTIVHSSVATVAKLDDLVKSAQGIFHLAATVGVELVLQKTSAAIRNNVVESDAILTAAARHGVRTLVASSSEVYGRSANELLSEKDELVLGPPGVARWSYGCSKLLVEFFALALAREATLPVVIARIFNTVGPRQSGRYGMVLPRFIEAARRGEPLCVFGDGRQSRCFCWVEDTVEALARLLEAPSARGEVVNVGNDQPITILELAELVRSECGSKSAIKLVPYAEAYGAGFEDLGRRRPDLSLLKRVTGFRPSVTLVEIVKRLAAAEPNFAGA